MADPFPFSAIVGQEDMKLAFLIAAVDPTVGGVLAFGDRGTGKSTAVRALAALLPKIRVVAGCPYNCEPERVAGALRRLPRRRQAEIGLASRAGGRSAARRHRGPRRRRAQSRTGAEFGREAFRAGAARRAPIAASSTSTKPICWRIISSICCSTSPPPAINLVEREGLSIRHPARFVLIGSGNPEEGELRPQMLDRFGLAVDVKTPQDVPTRIEVVRRRDAFERDPEAFLKRWAGEEKKLRAKIVAARERLGEIETPDAALERATRLCLALGTDGLRGELTLIRAARAWRRWRARREVGDAELRRVAPMALSHRLRRNPLDDSGSAARVERALAETFGP